MKTHLKIIIFISFFPFLGCSVLKVDRLPQNVPKGYVEFNRTNPQKSWEINGTQTFIYELKEGKKVFMGELGKGSRKINLRIACSPGNHTFIIHYTLPGITKIGKIEDDEVAVSIKENYIVLVNVIMTAYVHSTDVTRQSIVKKFSFNSDIRVEEATKIPMK